MIITIQELLKARGFDANAKVKLVRHKDARQDVYNVYGCKTVYDLYRHDKTAFMKYQSAQSKPVFHDVDYVVSFVGEDNNRARFIGVFKVIAKKPMDEEHRTDPRDVYYYEMEEMGGFDELKERVIVKWNNAIAWHQWYKNEMEVIEISPGLGYQQFTDYLDFVLTFDELKGIINNKYPDWVQMLSGVSGVYVIQDSKSKQLYVGSAYSDEGGIWSRWETYVKTNGHGNNKSLRALVNSDPDYAKNFTFSLLTIMSKDTPHNAVIAKEQLYKRKLGPTLNNN